MTRIINVAGNSGSGKTVLALNLAIALMQKGKDVLLFDGNIYAGDISSYTDFSPAVFLNEYLNGEREIEEVIGYHPSGIKIISSMPEERHDEEKNQKINGALLSLIGKSEIILVDSFSHNPALFSVINEADETIFVTNDDLPSIIKSREFIKKIEEYGMIVLGVVINKRRKGSNKKHIEAILGKKVLVEIPHDEKVIESINMKQPVVLRHPKSNISRAVNELAELLNINK